MLKWDTLLFTCLDVMWDKLILFTVILMSNTVIIGFEILVLIKKKQQSQLWIVWSFKIWNKEPEDRKKSCNIFPCFDYFKWNTLNFLLDFIDVILVTFRKILTFILCFFRINYRRLMFFCRTILTLSTMFSSVNSPLFFLSTLLLSFNSSFF